MNQSNDDQSAMFEQQPETLENESHKEEHQAIRILQTQMKEQSPLIQQLNNSIVLKYWDINDHNEIYLIKGESLKKSYDNIVKKLQKERMKFMKKQQTAHTQIEEDDQNFSKDEEKLLLQNSKNLKESFSHVKELFFKHYQTKTFLNYKQNKLKKTVDQLQEEIRQENLREIKDQDIVQYFNIERNKMSQSNMQIRKQ